MSIDGMDRYDGDGLRVYRWKVFRPWNDRFLAALTTRLGGQSRGPLSGLNLGHAVGDEPETLNANWDSLFGFLGLRCRDRSVMNQVHGTGITEALPGARPPAEGCDALELRRTGVVAAVMLADCLPVVVYDTVLNRGVICHAGRKGTASGIADAAVRRLIDGGSRIEHLAAAAGPGIGACCYTVGEGVADEFAAGFDYPESVFSRGGDGSVRLDLEEANLARLRHMGIVEDHLGRGGFCTACRREEFYSYRKEGGLTGRQAAVMALL